MTIMATAANAQSASFLGNAAWQKTVTTVSDSDHIAATQSIVGKDGSVIIAGTYDTDVTFGSSKLENPDEMTSAYVAKYDAQGNEQWAAGLYGSSVIRALTTDADGNIYVAGNHAGEGVKVFGANATDSTSIDGLTSWGNYIGYQRSAFIAKYDKDGKLLAVRNISTDELTTGDNAAAAAWSYLYFDTPRFIPTSIAVVGGKVVVAASYWGNVKFDNVSWTGRYFTSDLGEGMYYYQDANAVGVASFDADLTNATSLAELGQNGAEIVEAYNRTTSAGIASNGTDLYLVAAASGDLTLNVGGSTSEINFAPADGNTNYGFILANLNTGAYKSYECGADTLYAPVYEVNALSLLGSTLYVGGVTANHNPFVGADYKVTGATDLFVTAFSTADLSQTATWHDSFNEGDNRYFAESVTGLAADGGKVYLTGYAYQTATDSLSAVRNYTLDAATLAEQSVSSDNFIVSLSRGDNAIVTTANSGLNTATALYTAQTNSVKAIDRVAVSAEKVYNLQGQQVSDAYKGVVISGGKKFVRK